MTSETAKYVLLIKDPRDCGPSKRALEHIRKIFASGDPALRVVIANDTLRAWLTEKFGTTTLPQLVIDDGHGKAHVIEGGSEGIVKWYP